MAGESASGDFNLQAGYRRGGWEIGGIDGEVDGAVAEDCSGGEELIGREEA